MNWKAPLVGLLALALAVASGCGPKAPAKTAVTGRVVYRGEPLNGGVIVFVPDEERGNSGPFVKATVLLDGTFALGADLAAGWYRVAVAPLPAAEPTLPTASNPYPGPPARYRNPQLSGLAGEVRPGADNSFEFVLDD
jgi:hypothetical protein